jgi:hypothetical protein
MRCHFLPRVESPSGQQQRRQTTDFVPHFNRGRKESEIRILSGLAGAYNRRKDDLRDTLGPPALSGDWRQSHPYASTVRPLGPYTLTTKGT